MGSSPSADEKIKATENVSFSVAFIGAGVHNVLDEKHRHGCAYSTVPQRYLCFHHKKRGIIMKKVKIKLDDMERRILVKLLYEKRNELIREGRYTDAIDELILKIIDAKGC
jgi:hypothetical protein